MTISYPTALDELVNPSPADTLDTAGVLHTEQHGNANDAIEALEVKVGVTGSVDTNSLDYKINNIPAGVDGTNGTNGTNGVTPVKGVDYFDGVDGANSIIPGPQGEQGIQGVPGNNGAPGADGADGAPGTTTWAGITDKPATFTPETHNQTTDTITGLDTALSGKEATGVAASAVSTHAALKTGAHGLLDSIRIRTQVTPTAKTAAATLTIADLLTGIITGNPAAAVAYTLPTGTLCDGGVTMAVDEAFEWVLSNIATTATYIITLTAGAGHTIVGCPKVPSNSTTTGGLWGTASATFRTRKTAANTFVTYRIG